jgi:glycosyltransferase involved in cell wall biosynthesis
VNPHAVYRYGDEVMASVFYSTVRDPAKVVPHSVFTAASTDNPRKGLHCLLKAIALIKEEFPQLTVRVLGTAIRQSWRAKGYHKYLDRLIRALALEDRIVPLGSLTSESIAAELASADVYAFPSFADNSPSSVTEAMLVGTPIAASFVGGVPSRLRDGETALLFPAGDEIVLAECLRRLLHDRELAQRLAANARAVALERNDPAKVAQQMIDIYRFAIDRAHGRFRGREDG